MFDPELKPWDSAALFPIIEESGRMFTNKNGERTGLGGSAIRDEQAARRSHPRKFFHQHRRRFRSSIWTR